MLELRIAGCRAKAEQVLSSAPDYSSFISIPFRCRVPAVDIP